MADQREIGPSNTISGSEGNVNTPRAYILLVEDDLAFGEAGKKILRDAGFEVCHAEDFRLALEVLEGSQPIDLLLTDIVMPQRVNGLALARMARMRRPGLKVIYMTGYDLPGAEKEALGVVLRKPIDNDVLIAEVERALAG
jgi:DNA-binding NtrC family response regulator